MNTRFAPSPTGDMHIGNLRAAIMPYLYAKKNGCKFILRIDDTDTERSRDFYTQGIHEDLAWLGITWDYSFKQSEKYDRYKAAMEFCIAHNLVYEVFDTEDEVEELRQKLQRAKKPPAYKRNHAQNIPGRARYWRFDLGTDQIEFQDVIKGKNNISLASVSDPVICRPNGEFTYTFTSIIDDIEEQISCIIRGVDHLTNTAVQLKILRDMMRYGYSATKEPDVAHYPLFCAPGGKKFSKRTGNFSLYQMKEWAHPLSLFHYITFMGQKGRVCNLDELVQEFDLKNYASSNVIEFNIEEVHRWQRKVVAEMDFAQVNAWCPSRMNESQWACVRDSVCTKADLVTWDTVLNSQKQFSYVQDVQDAPLARKKLTGGFHGPKLDELMQVMDPSTISVRSEKAQPLRIEFYNTIAGQEQEFIANKPGHVSMYVCGPTVYDLPHIGNLRPFVIFDVLRRFLSEFYPKVVFARNITDIDDKIIDRAAKLEMHLKELTQQVYQDFSKQMKALNVLTPNHEPHVTDNIPQIIAMIQKIIDAGVGYVNEDGVYFGIANYCKEQNYDVFRCLKNHTACEQDDFALWKFRKSDEIGWDSPWGWGRPGWHIECSAMSETIFGTKFDIHGGGRDLIFPHHANEIAQCCAANHTTQPMARYWLHNNILINSNSDSSGEKMSKSLGNVIRLDNIDAHPMVVRLALIMTHYRSKIEWKDEVVTNACNLYNKWRRNLGRFLQANPGFVPSNGFIIHDFAEALASDLNTAEAIRILDEHTGKLTHETYSDVMHSFGVLGIKFEFDYINNREIRDMAQQRQILRREGKFTESDAIREKLKSMRVDLEESRDCVYWYAWV